MKFLISKVGNRKVVIVAALTLVLISLITLSLILTSSTGPTKLLSSTGSTTSTTLDPTTTSGVTTTSTTTSTTLAPTTTTTLRSTTTTAPPAPPTWQQIQPVSSIFSALKSTTTFNAINSISCPTTTTCFADFDNILYVSHDTGVTWSEVSSLLLAPNTYIYGITCLDNIHCFATEHNALYQQLLVYSSNGGLTWNTSKVPFTYSSQEADVYITQCVQGSATCIAEVSENTIMGELVLYSTNYGQSFSYSSLPSAISSTGNSFTTTGINSIFCQSASFCIVTTQTQNGSPGSTDNASLLESYNGGETWSIVLIGSPPVVSWRTASLGSPICVSSLDCYVSGFYGLIRSMIPETPLDFSNAGSVLLTTINGGNTWNTSISNPPATVPFVPLQTYCFGAQCYGLNQYNPTSGIYQFNLTTDHWVNFAPFPVQANTLMSCASASDCLVYEGNGANIIANYLVR